MALIAIDDLPETSAEVLRRRARTAGLPVAEYVRGELITRGRTRVPDDAVVEFVQEQGRDLGPALDADATALVDAYDLPFDTIDRFGRRAGAVGQPLADYVRGQLISLARRTTIDDALAEFREAQHRDPSLDLDMDAIAAALRYVRGE